MTLNDQNAYAVTGNQQEARLTLRGQRGRCRNIKGEPKYMRASVTQGYAHFSYGCGFMVGLGIPKLCTKLEFASFSRCLNIKGKAPNFGELPSPGPHPLFLLVGFDDGPWQTLAACQI